MVFYQFCRKYIYYEYFLILIINQKVMMGGEKIDPEIFNTNDKTINYNLIFSILFIFLV